MGACIDLFEVLRVTNHSLFFEITNHAVSGSRREEIEEEIAIIKDELHRHD